MIAAKVSIPNIPRFDVENVPASQLFLRQTNHPHRVHCPPRLFRSIRRHRPTTCCEHRSSAGTINPASSAIATPTLTLL